MGQPVRILDLAEQMIRLAGYKPYEEIDITFTGLRPGEKMFEELFHFSETHAKTAHESIWLAGERHLPLDAMNRLLAELRDVCQARRGNVAAQVLTRLVPEYKPNPEAQSA